MITGVAPTPTEVISGRFGSSENVAVHVRDVSSGHVTVTVVGVDVTATGPGRTSLESSVMACADDSVGNENGSADEENVFTFHFLLSTFNFLRFPLFKPLPCRVVHLGYTPKIDSPLSSSSR